MQIFAKVKRSELVDFTKNLSVMLKSGITINEAFGTLAEQTKSRSFKTVLTNVKGNLEAGTTLSDALAKEKSTFGGVYMSLVKAGEASGGLDENLTFLADWLERNHDLRTQIKAAMLYPKIILVSTVALGGLLTTFVLPRLIPLFESLDVELPLATRILLNISLFVRESLFTALAIGLVVIVGTYLIFKLKPIKWFTHGFVLKMPFFGQLALSYQMALLSQLYFTLLKSGISINESLEIMKEAPSNVRYRASLFVLQSRLAKGTTLTEAMGQFPLLYPGNVVNIIATGEKAGTLEESLSYLSEFYTKEVNNRVKRLPTVIEPILLLFIGAGVGFIAMAIITPIYKLLEGL
jgi:type IV pilus assembly protein PilC